MDWLVQVSIWNQNFEQNKMGYKRVQQRELIDRS